MARVFIDGFESQKWLASSARLWDLVSGSVLSVYTGYETGYAFGTPGNSSNLDKYLSSSASYYVGFHFKGYYMSKVFRFMNGTTVLGLLYYNAASGHFYAYKGDQATLLQQATILVKGNDWCHHQIYYLPHATAGTFPVKVK